MAADEGDSIAKHSKHTLTQEAHPPSYVDWSSAMQAYYGAGTTPPFFASNVASSTPYPYIWGGQHPMMPPYMTPVPYPALYSGFYPHPTMPMTPQPTAKMETKARNRKERASKIKRKGTLGNTNVVGVGSEEGVKVASSSRNDRTTTQSVDSENDGSSDAVVPNYNPAVPMPTIASILNMGIDLWNPSAENVSVEMSPNPSGSFQTTMPDHRARQDGRELKRQKRKQCNREAAIMSRQRKQNEWEEQQAEVYALSIENHTLGHEMRMLSEECKKLRSENNAIQDKLSKICDEDKSKSLELDAHLQSGADEDKD